MAKNVDPDAARRAQDVVGFVFLLLASLLPRFFPLSFFLDLAALGRLTAFAALERWR